MNKFLMDNDGHLSRNPEYVAKGDTKMKTMMEEIKEHLSDIWDIGNNTNEMSSREDLDDAIVEMMNAINDLEVLIDAKFPNV